MAIEGGNAAGVARKEIESQTGESVVKSDNYLDLKNKTRLEWFLLCRGLSHSSGELRYY